MAQSAVTVTPPNPTPPTNFSSVGGTPPTPVPNYTKTSYANPFNMTAVNSPQLAADGRPQSPYGVNPNPPPYFDDGAAGSGLTFAANTAALASGTGATSGGTENTYPGTGTGVSGVGAVPAASSAPSEGAGTEVAVTQTYPATIFNPGGPLVTVSDLGNFTGVANSPNASHASSLSPAGIPTLTSLGTPSTASGGGTVSQTVTGTGFTRQSVIYVNGVAQVTTYNSSTSLTAAAVTKKASAGTWPVVVITGGTVTTAPQTWTFT